MDVAESAQHVPAHVRDRLPTFVVIGAMKCGTTALHGLLAARPDISMSAPKELNFFFGGRDDGRRAGAAGPSWMTGNWSRGIKWYAGHFDPRSPVRGEASPGYTSPSHPEAPARMGSVLPDARLVYLVRDPVDRAVSQYHHHVAQGTETRPAGTALLDPASQYVARGRYHERLLPFLGHYPLERIAVVSQEALLRDTAQTLAGVLRFVGAQDRDVPPVDPGPASDRPRPAHVPLDEQVRDELRSRLADDAARLRALLGRDFPQWCV